MPEEHSEFVGESIVAPPPLFSPHVYVLDKHERRTFESGYTTELSCFMVSDYDELYPVLLMAKKYNFPVAWFRELEIVVHEAWALRPTIGFTVHDVVCKVAVGEQTGRTDVQNLNAERKVVWNQNFKYHVQDACEIVMLIYCKNSILPNDKLGRVWVTPEQLIENKTITEWFQLNTYGEVKMSITLSPPELVPFKFSFSSRLSVSSCDSHIFNANDEKVFTLIGKWPYSISLLDSRGITVLTFKNCVNEPREREYTLYLYGQSTHTLTLTQTCGIGESEFKIEGLSNVAAVKTIFQNFNFFSESNTRVASAKLVEQKYFVEIQPVQYSVIILGTMALIAKLLFVEGQAVKEWSRLRSSGSSFLHVSDV